MDAVSQTSKPTSFAITNGERKASASDKLQDRPSHVLIRRKFQQLAGKTAVPDSVISRCQVDKYGIRLLLSLKKSSIFCVSKTVCSTVDLRYRNPACFLGRCESIIDSTRVWISLLKIL